MDVSLSQADLDGLEECFKRCENPFLGLETQYQQIQYYRQNFNLIVRKLISVNIQYYEILYIYRNLLESHWETAISGKGVEPKEDVSLKEDSIMYIPILQTLQCFLNNHTVLSEVSDHYSHMHACIATYVYRLKTDTSLPLIYL